MLHLERNRQDHFILCVWPAHSPMDMFDESNNNVTIQKISFGSKYGCTVDKILCVLIQVRFRPSARFCVIFVQYRTYTAQKQVKSLQY